MGCCKYSQGVLVFVLNQLCLLLATSPVKVLQVPSSAEPGHVIAILPNQYHNGIYQMRMGGSSISGGKNAQKEPKSDLSEYFTVMDQGHMITTQNISHLDGERVPLNIEHVNPSGPAESWSQKLFGGCHFRAFTGAAVHKAALPRLLVGEFSTWKYCNRTRRFKKRCQQICPVCKT